MEKYKGSTTTYFGTGYFNYTSPSDNLSPIEQEIKILAQKVANEYKKNKIEIKEKDIKMWAEILSKDLSNP